MTGPECNVILQSSITLDREVLCLTCQVMSGQEIKTMTYITITIVADGAVLQIYAAKFATKLNL